MSSCCYTAGSGITFVVVFFLFKAGSINRGSRCYMHVWVWWLVTDCPWCGSRVNWLKWAQGTSRTTSEGPLAQGLEAVPLNSGCSSCHLVVLWMGYLSKFWLHSLQPARNQMTQKKIGYCYGLNCVLKKFIYWSPSPQHLKMWLYLEIVSSKRWGHQNEAIRTLLSLTCILIRRGNLDTQRDTTVVHAQRKDHVRTQQESGLLQAKKRDHRRNQACWHPDCEKIHHLIFGILLWET